MKIGDVNVGEEYGVVAKKHRYDSLPRQARVVEVVVEPEEVWVGHGFTSSRALRNVRRVKVELLGQPTEQKTSGWHYDNAVHALKEGSKVVVEAKQLVGPWRTLRKGVAHKIELKNAEAEREQQVVGRVEALLPRKLRGKWGRVRITGRLDSKNKPVVLVTVSLDDDAADHLLTLAEAGANKVSS